MGGLEIDPQSHVLDLAHKPIPGLFASGEMCVVFLSPSPHPDTDALTLSILALVESMAPTGSADRHFCMVSLFFLAVLSRTPLSSS